MKGTFLFYFYRLILVPTASVILFIFRPLLPGKLRIITFERRKKQWIFIKKSSGRLDSPFWIHAASGEIEYARPLIRELKNKFPHIPIVVTYSSPSAQRLLHKITEVDAWGPSPWDSVCSCQEFLSRVKPRAVFFSRTDVWPEISYQLKLKKIPSLLFSATFAENSSRMKGFTKYLTIWTLHQLTQVLVVSKEDQDQLQKAGFISSVACGDTRYDQVFFRLTHPQSVHEISRPSLASKTLVAGSTWPEDEKILFAWFVQKYKKNPLNLILAPHEISKSRLQNIVDNLKTHGIESQFYSQQKKWTSGVLIIDEIGILAELYIWGNAALVGGSFRKQVHSVMEPLACGLPVCVGPFHKNNREALDFQKIKISELPLVSCIQSTEDLEIFWQQILTLNKSDHIAIQQQVKSLQGATQAIFQALNFSN